MASTTGYTYQPLKTPSSIRLLKLLPGYVHGMISCTIEEFRDVERPDYHALSYCWGDPKPTRKILLNNHERGLHENLWQFLHQTLDAGRCSPYYWTDSLCLDQSKTEELKQQVPRMGIMYTNAALVVVWLGI
ncbi:HET-domain-containing protein, partial [Acephala macrosclerotiorum]